MLVRVKQSSVTDEVVKQIICLIKEGKMKPGDKLPNELELMRNLNVGRSTIREAKRVLMSKQLLESHQGRGTFIRELEFDEILDQDVLDVLFMNDNILEPLYETREILETETAVLAAIRAEDTDIRKMEEALQRMKESENENQLYERGFKFHMSIAKASRNPILMQIYFITLKSLRNNQRFIYEIVIPDEIAIHSQILDAIIKRDIEQTRVIMKKHFDYVRFKTKSKVGKQ